MVDAQIVKCDSHGLVCSSTWHHVLKAIKAVARLTSSLLPTALDINVAQPMSWRLHAKWNYWNLKSGLGTMYFNYLNFDVRERQRQVRKWQQQQRGRQSYNRPMPIKQRESSVTVKSDWVVIEEMEKTQLAKLSLPTVMKLKPILANIF